MNIYDIIVVGAGPAGLTAALYACRAGKRVLVLEKGAFGGQITYSPKVENIPGFTSLSGNEFAERMVEQVLGQGADVEPCEVLSIREEDGLKTVLTDGGSFCGRAVVIATGARHRLPGIEREEEFIGRGISFCAVCDGAFYEGKTVAVLGGGNSALQEALLLSELAKKVYVVQNLDRLTGEARLAEQLYRRENVEILTGSLITALSGGEELSAVTVTGKDGTQQELTVDGLFVAIGLVPQNEPFASLLTLDDYGYADADESCLTPTPGVFVAGDCRKKRIRQVATAAADGAVAALAAVDYLDN